VIDDDPSTIVFVRMALMPGTVDEISYALLPDDGIRSALETRPDLILLDINLPQLDGFEVCRILKENTGTHDIPILFLTVHTSAAQLARAFDCGAADYIRKPVDEIELQARVRVALNDQRLVRDLREQARIDALTSLNNRAALDDAVASVVSAHARTGFKDINDHYGHGVGDEVLRSIGRVVRGTCRPYDTPCRFGGDEFAVVFRHTEGDETRGAAIRLLAALGKIEIQNGDDTLRFSVSAGLATTADCEENFEPGDLMKAADRALYSAKAKGRNRLEVASLRPIPIT
jgi:diguanylate cyclase (GGDEF)-like protein